MNRVATIILVIVFLTGFAEGISASTAASGTVTATQTCEAYVSKNKRSNPDQARLVIGEVYTVFEANKPKEPDWYRVRIDGANPPERWISERCGTVDVRLGVAVGPNENIPRESCNTAGLEDGYVLALSWQPAFCDSHRDKPECRIDDAKSYQARNFTLHGLWPNRGSCGIHYEFCGEVRSQAREFCNYPPLPLDTEVRAELGIVMPSAAAGSCLQRHEWFKHGTCQNDWSLDQYFSTALDLARQFNESGIAYFISRNIGSTVSETDLINRVDCTHGAGAHKSLELKCDNGNLVDVYVRLPDPIVVDKGIGDLMRQAGGEFKSNCGGRFKVDPIGFSR